VSAHGNRLDVLGLTFAEVLAALRPRPAELPGLRAEYARVLRTGRPGPRLSAEAAPAVRPVRDGGTIKFTQRSPAGLESESVVVPMQRNRRCWRTLCVSSQVGCALGCTFCQTAQLGWREDLSAAAIVGQLVAAVRDLAVVIRNVVFMGMGEPLDNFENVVQAIRVMTDPAGLSLARERITISTVGRVQGIRRLAQLGWRRINLAVSLNAPNDQIRSRIMPINRAEPMAELRAALLEYPLRNCQFLMIEYVLIPGVNDQREHARELCEFLRPLRCCVNVIPYNPRLESPWPAPSEEAVQRFVEWVAQAGQPVKRRVTRGREFMAACGQLGNRALARRGLAGLPVGVPGGSAFPPVG
jgi:23S rRNA (adenine2503-C2)-methyltransferase